MDVSEGYFRFLLNKVHETDGVLNRWLYEQEFVYPPEIFSDHSRVSDGIELRYEYIAYVGELINNVPADDAVGELLEQPCNMLEMLVALALRIDTDITGEPGVDRAFIWFHEMLQNLGLYEQEPRLWPITLQRFLNRQYSYAGIGGLFPLRYPQRDQRTIGIWDQLSDYLNEMYRRNGL